MNKNKYRTLPWLIGRSLLPSAISGLLCLCFGVFFEALHLVLLSLNIGTALPNFFSGQWATMYTNDVVQPLETLFNNRAYATASDAVLWGLVGLGVYLFFRYSGKMYMSWHAAQHNVQLSNQQLIAHPARKEFFITVLWRLGVVALALLLFWIIHPLVGRALTEAPRLVVGDLSLQGAVQQLGFAVLLWILLAHVLVVLLRLFAMRTRIFGDPAIT